MDVSIYVSMCPSIYPCVQMSAHVSVLPGYMLFDIYDLDGNGTLEFDEVRLLIREICDGEVMHSTQAKL